MARRRREPSTEERALWRANVKDAVPLHRGTLPPTTPPSPPPTEAPPRFVRKIPPETTVPPHADAAPVPPFRIGAKARMSTSTVDSAPTLTQRLSSSGPEMDRRLKRDVKRGRLRPEARIDLHGMTLDDAHGALSGFIVACHGRGCQIVLVITGKGRGGADRPGQIPAPRGRLRHQVPDWLNAGPLRALVKGFMPAAQRHGGEGAYYVWLRRNG